jgi:hypothetical protein
MTSFLGFFIASFVVASAWTIVVLTTDRRIGRWMGLMGSWAATLVLAALWQSEAVPWLLALLKGVLLIWVCAMAVVVTGFVSVWRVQAPGRLALLGCAALSLGVNVAAGLHFLWLATVSSGGV